MSFETLGLCPDLVSALHEQGIDTPTPVQAAAIPKALAGNDLIVSSQTGSGKTAAFMLPALERLNHHSSAGGRGVQVLVLAPTRELAMQVADATRDYSRHLRQLRVATVVGGMPYGAQIKSLARRVDVLVATPGRLIDHLQSRRVNLSTVHTLVLDEADRMLDMGFIEDIEAIVNHTPAERQTLLFSATLDGKVAHLVSNLLRDPQRIEITPSRQDQSHIQQHLLYADDGSHKRTLLDHLLRDVSLDQAIVFTATKHGADELASHLTDEGFQVAALHGDMNQRQRTRTLGLLQKGRVRVLVATDVAARGIDVQAISHVVNYDLPMQAEDYVHRIGRTGRAGRSGQAYTLAVPAERHKIRRIEHFIGHAIQAEIIPGLEPRRSVRPTYKDHPRKASGPRSGKPADSRMAGGKAPWYKDANSTARKAPWQAAADGRDEWQKDAASGDRKPVWHKKAAPGEGRPARRKEATSDEGRPAWHKKTPSGEGRPAWHKDGASGNAKPTWRSAGTNGRPTHSTHPAKPGVKRNAAPKARNERRESDRASHAANH